MLKVKVSPSLLDAFNHYLTGKYNETEERLLDKINKRAEYQQTEAMYKGTAFHKVTEAGHPLCDVIWDKKLSRHCYRYEFYDFDKEHVDEVREARAGMWHEQWVSRPLQTQYGDILLYGKVDDIGHCVVQDLKTTKNYSGNLSYFDALQWRVYVFCTRTRTFNYLISDFTTLYHEQYHPYPGLEDDLLAIAERYWEFIYDNQSKIDLQYVTYNEER